VSIVIAVDGTAASGKGTLAKKLAAHFGFAHLDTGALYRLTALATVQNKGDPADPNDALRAAQSIDLGRTNDLEIRTAEIGRIAAVVAAVPSVRRQLLQFQRNFAIHPPGAKGCVIDGRDIGTVVCPAADAKLFIDAAIGVRAHRRYLELALQGPANEAEILNDLVARDAADRTRKISPLVHAPDAILIDTTTLSVSEMCDLAISEVAQRLSGKTSQRELPLE
jgi:cytidylate kinase